MLPGPPPSDRRPGVRVPCLQNPAPDAVTTHLRDHDFVWIDYAGPSEEDLDHLARELDLHPLTLEDAHTFHQRPKIEEYEGYTFLVVFGADAGDEAGAVLLREVHVIVSGEFVVTIHRHPFTPLAELRSHYHDLPVRSEQFMVYKIIDAVISTFVPVLSRTDDDIDDIEQSIIDDPTDEQLQQIFSLKRDLVSLRRVVAPMRDMLAANADRLAALPGLDSDDRLYFRDLYDGLVRVSELVDSYRDLLSGATDMYLSTVANRQGEINKQLTIIATIFLPLTFLTGFFGQNFSFLTSRILDTTWSFLVFGLGGLLLSAIGFWIYFRRKRWI